MMSRFASLLGRVRSRAARRAALTLCVACVLSLGLSLGATWHWRTGATARLNSAAARLDSLTDRGTPDERDRSAVAWGYAERLRLGLESPFRLIEAAGRDPRLLADERRTVAWALLAHVLRGETYDIDPAALDGLGPMIDNRSASGEEHLALIERAIASTRNPRAAELAVRFAYTLAASERLVDGSAPVIVAEAAALLADREVARREAVQVVRAARADDPLKQVRARRAHRAFYVERPALLPPTDDIEEAAVALTPALLDAIRSMPAVSVVQDSATSDSVDVGHARRLYAVAARVPPSAPLAVTVQRYLSMLRAQAHDADVDAIARAYNPEMLAAAVQPRVDSRVERRAVARVVLASAVAMRSTGQQSVWFPGDSVPDAVDLAAQLGVADITFDRAIPKAWQPFFLQEFATSVRDLRRVLPAMKLDGLHVRFRTTSPADSALAMHDPRTRTLHLPIYSAGGTLSHELAHDLDRQSAVQDGLAGYRSDIVARSDMKSARGREAASNKLAASLRALTEELSETPRTVSATAERPAEIFATRVDWFVANALAQQGISDGFLSAVQDELLTGHVVHPERLRGASRSRSLVTALEGMTSVAPFALVAQEPSIQTLLRWTLNTPVDRRAVADIARGEASAWQPSAFMGVRSCSDGNARVELLRLAAESRARGWLRLRARWTSESQRPAWARAMLGTPPWSDTLAEARVARLRDLILLDLAPDGDLPSGLSAYAAPLVRRALCD
ncbi:MAG TPA: hypothetical protein VJ867_01755 [Gemmatimonadaceae bacterium]|nr:hypothetical protein [Gemmatimonadaceae bacterium]